MTETQAFVESSSRSAAETAENYVALWNEPDADRRRRMIATLWAKDGSHILQPPQEIRAIAALPGIAMTAILTARGYEQIEARAASVYEHWIGARGSASAGATTPSDSATSSSCTARRSPRTPRCSRSGSASSPSPRTAESRATTRSSSPRRDGAAFSERRKRRVRSVADVRRDADDRRGCVACAASPRHDAAPEVDDVSDRPLVPHVPRRHRDDGGVMTVEADGVTLGAEHFGDAAAPLVLLAGGTTMLSWPDALCEALAGGRAPRRSV